MTCLIGAHSIHGEILVLADSCISWPIRNQRERRVYEDELEKLYTIREGVLCAICGDLLTAQEMLVELKSQYNSGGMPSSADTPTKRTWHLTRSLKKRWETSSEKGLVHLIIIEAENENKSIWAWSSNAPENATFISPGEVEILGTLQNSEHDDFREKLREELRNSATFESQRAPLDGYELANLMNSQILTFFRDRPIAGIGGLFRAAYESNGKIEKNCFDAGSISTVSGIEYAVKLEEDPNTGHTYQINSISGQRVRIKRLDEHNFKRSTRIRTEFNY